MTITKTPDCLDQDASLSFIAEIRAANAAFLADDNSLDALLRWRDRLRAVNAKYPNIVESNKRSPNNERFYDLQRKCTY